VVAVSKELEQGRRLFRRNAAKTAFWAMLLAGVVILAALLLHPDRLGISQALSGASAIIIAYFSFCSSIVLGYFSASVVEAIKKDHP
jgi:MFS superfamily sulfate permease-like transporter